jgi:serine/threonine protein kinase
MLGGRYKLLNELGSGGMAVVWRGRDEVLGRPVAIKVLAARFAGDPQSRARIRDEARAAANLSHPNIAQVYDYGEAISSDATGSDATGSDATGSYATGGDATNGDVPLPYVVMELINGPTLQQRVASGPLPPRKVFRICGEVAAALAAAHAEDLVHRDIKMANIMVTPAGAKVVDFGIAAAVGPAPEDMLVGTPAYLAPERLTGDAVVPASDVYALGVLLYRLLAGESPWSVESTTQMLQAHVYVEPAPLPSLGGVPPAVATLINRCLHKNPESRPSAAEVSSILADAAEASDALRRPDVRRDDVPTHTRIAAPVHPSTAAHSRPDGHHGDADETGILAPRPGTRAEPAAETVALGGDGARPARSGAHRTRRRSLLAAGVAALVAAAALLTWLLSGDDKPTRQLPSAAGTRSAGSAVAVAGAPARTNHGGGGAPAPAAITAAVAGSPAAGGGRPTPSAARSVLPAPTVAASSDAPAPSESPAAEPSAAPAPVGKRLASKGGTVQATCDDGKATLSDWQPADGFEVERVIPGPALSALVIFRGGLARYRMNVSCVAGSPTAVVLPL